MEKLTGKTALITGGSRGIGRAIALGLADEGVNIVITGRDTKTLEAVLNELEPKDINVSTIEMDITKEEDIKAAVAHTVDTFGQIDILINNAGIMETGPFLETNAESFERMLKTNLLGPFHTMQEVLPHMIEKSRGDIVNIASMSAINSTEQTAAYSATKFGLTGLTEGVMKEMRKHNIRVFTINPSAVLTDLIGDVKLDPESMTHPEDIADVIISQLKLNPRTFVKTNQIWATNPHE